MVRVVFLAVMRKLGEKANELTDTLVNRIGLHVRISVQPSSVRFTSNLRAPPELACIAGPPNPVRIGLCLCPGPRSPVDEFVIAVGD